MQLIGMLDSPYVRRVAISLRLMGLAFEHRAVSVFSTFEEFQRINPIVKAPSLICEDGTVLMDSTLILEYAHALGPVRRLLPQGAPLLQRTLRVLGLALAGCEKSVQAAYERNLRPPDKQHTPWLERVRGQASAAYAALERELVERPLEVSRERIDLAGVTTAVVWQFTQSMVADVADPSRHPALVEHSRRAEALPEFLACPPIGPGVPAT